MGGVRGFLQSYLQSSGVKLRTEEVRDGQGGGCGGGQGAGRGAWAIVGVGVGSCGR